MAEQTKVKLTKDKLAIEGIQVNVIIFAGDWRRSVAISPISYEVFKKWDKIYAKIVIDSMVRQIEHELDKVEDM